MGRKGGGGKAKGAGGKKKGGRSISNVKRNNLKRQKLVKAGKLKPKSTPRFVEGGHLKGKTAKKVTLKPEEIAEREQRKKEDDKQWVRGSGHATRSLQRRHEKSPNEKSANLGNRG